MERHDDRTEFKRDYDRLIFSAPFRRLQNKTQVFPLPGSVFVHNRLTHSLEVASVGMSLGNDVSARIIKDKRPELKGTLFEEIGQIVATACLAHDLGNPPFGHSGEKAIQTFFTEGNGRPLQEMVSPEFWGDITHFEGNANAFRLLTHQFNRWHPARRASSDSLSVNKRPFSALPMKWALFANQHLVHLSAMPAIRWSILWRLLTIFAMRLWTWKMPIS